MLALLVAKTWNLALPKLLSFAFAHLFFCLSLLLPAQKNSNISLPCLFWEYIYLNGPNPIEKISLENKIVTIKCNTSHLTNYRRYWFQVSGSSFTNNFHQGTNNQNVRCSGFVLKIPLKFQSKRRHASYHSGNAFLKKFILKLFLSGKSKRN